MQTKYQSSFTTVIEAKVEEVWDALTNPTKVKQYFFGSDQQCEWKVGSEITWSGEFDGNPYLDKGKIIEYDPYSKISYSYLSSWSGLPDKTESYLRVNYELSPVSNGTKLTITQSNYDQEKAEHSAKNWEAVINGLKKIVE